MTITKSLSLIADGLISDERLDQFHKAMVDQDILAFTSHNPEDCYIESYVYVEGQPGIDPTPKALKALSELEWITQVVIKTLDEE